MKWFVDGHEFESARMAAEFIMANVDEEYYDDFLDDIYGEIEICGYKYAPSVALYRVDPVAYNCGRSDWEDFESSNLADELELMSDGEVLEFFDSVARCEEEPEEEEEKSE